MSYSHVDWRLVLVFVCALGSLLIRDSEYRAHAQSPDEIKKKAREKEKKEFELRLKDLVQPEPGDDDLRKLLKERYNAATLECALRDARSAIDARPVSSGASIYRRAAVAIELFEKPDDRARLTKQFLDLMKAEEERMKGLAKAGGISPALPQDVEKAIGERLDLEILLLKAKWPVKPTFNPDDKGDLKPEPGDDDLRKLLKARYNSAALEYSILNRPTVGESRQIVFAKLQANYFRAHAAVELFTKREDQLRIADGLIGPAKAMEKAMLDEWGQGGVSRFRRLDVANARGQRLDLEILLLAAKWPIKPTLNPDENWEEEPDPSDSDSAKRSKERYNAAILKAEPGDNILRSLRKERFNSATRAHADLRMRFRIEVDKVECAEQTITCNQRRAQLVWELFAKPVDQVRILQMLLDESTELENDIRVCWQGGTKFPDVYKQDVERVRGARLDLEIMLVKARQNLKPTK